MSFNYNIEVQAVEALAIQRDHYRECIEAYNRGE